MMSKGGDFLGNYAEGFDIGYVINAPAGVSGYSNRAYKCNQGYHFIWPTTARNYSDITPATLANVPTANIADRCLYGIFTNQSSLPATIAANDISGIDGPTIPAAISALTKTDLRRHRLRPRSLIICLLVIRLVCCAPACIMDSGW